MKNSLDEMRRQIQRRFLTPIILSILLLFTGRPQAAFPTSIVYQGSLKKSGAPLNATGVSMQFKIYDALTGGTLKWTTTAPVDVKQGLYRVELAPDKSLVDWGAADFYLETCVTGTCLAPREKLTGAPSAMVAQDLAGGAIAKGDLTVSGTLTTEKAPVTFKSHLNNTRLTLFPTGSDELMTLMTVGNKSAMFRLANEETGTTARAATGLALSNKSANIMGSVVLVKYANGYTGSDDAGLPLSNSAHITLAADNIARWVWYMGTPPVNEGIYFEGGNPFRVQANLTQKGQIRMAGGDAANPTFSFYDDNGVGLFRSAPGSLGLSTAGKERVSVLPNGDVKAGGRVYVDNNTDSGGFGKLIGRGAVGINVSFTIENGEFGNLYVKGTYGGNTSFRVSQYLIGSSATASNIVKIATAADGAVPEFSVTSVRADNYKHTVTVTVPNNCADFFVYWLKIGN